MKTQVTRYGSLMVANLRQTERGNWHGKAEDGFEASGDNLCNGNVAWVLPIAREQRAA